MTSATSTSSATASSSVTSSSLAASSLDAASSSATTSSSSATASNLWTLQASFEAFCQETIDRRLIDKKEKITSRSLTSIYVDTVAEICGVQLQGKCNYSRRKECLMKAYPEVCFAKQASASEPEIVYFQPSETQAVLFSFS